MKSVEAETRKPSIHTPLVCKGRVVLSLMVTSVYSSLLLALKHMERNLGESGSAVT